MLIQKSGNVRPYAKSSRSSPSMSRDEQAVGVPWHDGYRKSVRYRSKWDIDGTLRGKLRDLASQPCRFGTRPAELALEPGLCPRPDALW
jgi:hypothetical protein